MNNLTHWFDEKPKLDTKAEIKKWETLKRTHLGSLRTIDAKLRDLYAQSPKSI